MRARRTPATPGAASTAGDARGRRRRSARRSVALVVLTGILGSAAFVADVGAVPPAGRSGGAKPLGKISSANVSFGGVWSVVDTCTSAGCAGQKFPTTAHVDQCPGASHFTGIWYPGEPLTGTVSGNSVTLQEGGGGYDATVHLTVSPDGNSWAGSYTDNGGGTGTTKASRVSTMVTLPCGAPPTEKPPVLCVDIPGESCTGVDVTLPKTPVINTLDDTEVSIGCDDSSAEVASAHISATIGIPPNVPIPTTLEAPKKPKKCKTQLQIEAAKGAQERETKKVRLLEKQLEIEQREAPLNEKKAKLLKELKELSQGWGDEELEAPQASTASLKKGKVHRIALPFGLVRLEMDAHTRMTVKLQVPKRDRRFVTLLRRAHIRVLHLSVRITVIRSGETKTTSYAKLVTYHLSKK
jgi:hypothetical protein